MRAGRLRHRIRVLARSDDKNDAGERTRDRWREVAEVWANVVEQTGRDRIGSQLMEFELDARIFLRWLSSIEPDMVVEYAGRRYEIVAPPIDRTGRRAEMELLVRFEDGRQR